MAVALPTALAGWSLFFGGQAGLGGDERFVDDLEQSRARKRPANGGQTLGAGDRRRVLAAHHQDSGELRRAGELNELAQHGGGDLGVGRGVEEQRDDPALRGRSGPVSHQIVAKPEVRNQELTLTVERLTGLGFVLPRESVQPALDAFLKQMTENYPMGIHADSVEVTDAGVVGTFSSTDATIPSGDSDPCFADL